MHFIGCAGNDGKKVLTGKEDFHTESSVGRGVLYKDMKNIKILNLKHTNIFYT